MNTYSSVQYPGMLYGLCSWDIICCMDCSIICCMDSVPGIIYVVWTLFLGYYMLYGLFHYMLYGLCFRDNIELYGALKRLLEGYYMLYGLCFRDNIELYGALKRLLEGYYMLYGLCFRDNIELYGALKRLLEWNNSDFKFMNLLTDVQDNDRFEPWVTMLRGQITTLHHFDISLADTIWKGAIQIVGTNVGTAFILHHFYISLADTIWKGAIQIVGTNVGTCVCV